MVQNFEEMTVLALRKFAKENKIRLSANIDKQGIINTIKAAYTESAETAASCDAEEKATEQVSITEVMTENAPASPEATASDAAEKPGVRRAAIITDEPEDTDDEPSFNARGYRSTAGGTSANPRAASISNISSKAPAFTMEGTRAWHNPRSFNPAPPAQNYVRTQWSTKPVYPQQPSVRSTAESAMGPRNGFGPGAAAEVNDAMTERRYAMPEVKSVYQRSMEYNESLMQQDFAQLNRSVEPAKEADADALIQVKGYLDIISEGCAYVRTASLLPSKDDVYVPAALVNQLRLKKGDHIIGSAMHAEADRYAVLNNVAAVDHLAPKNLKRTAFEDLTPIYPKKKLPFANSEELSADARIIDLLSPIGYGQRALLVIPAHAGKTTLLQHLSDAAYSAGEDTEIMYLLLDEKPEEITEAGLMLKAPLYATTAQQGADGTIKLCEAALEAAQRLCEMKQHAVLIVDSLDALANAYNCAAPAASRTIAGTLSAYALQCVKKFFATARNTKEGGSITIIAAIDSTAPLTQEILPIANMTLYLDAQLAKKKVYPPIDLSRCQTRKGELMMTKQEIDSVASLRQSIQRGTTQEGIQQLLFMVEKTKHNSDLYGKIDEWLKMLG